MKTLLIAVAIAAIIVGGKTFAVNFTGILFDGSGAFSRDGFFAIVGVLMMFFGLLAIVHTARHANWPEIFRHVAENAAMRRNRWQSFRDSHHR